MKRMLFLLSFVFIVGASEAWAQCKDIRIPRGQISTRVKGISKKNYDCYRIRARAGQKIVLRLAAADKRVTFSLREDYYDADFTAENARDWEGEIGNVDAYLISVGGGKRGAAYTLEVAIK